MLQYLSNMTLLVLSFFSSLPPIVRSFSPTSPIPLCPFRTLDNWSLSYTLSYLSHNKYHQKHTFHNIVAIMSRFQAAFLCSLLLPQALAVSLADFKPYATDLSKGCEMVYTSQISGCQQSDFTSGACSVKCVNALNALVPTVSSKCQGVTGNNIIVAMMLGQGTSNLCKSTAAASPTTLATSTAEVSSASETSEPTETSSLQSTTILYQTYSVMPQTSSSVDTVIFVTSTPASVIAASKTAESSSTSPTQSNINQGGSLLSGQTGAGTTHAAQGAAVALAAAIAGAALLL